MDSFLLNEKNCIDNYCVGGQFIFSVSRYLVTCIINNITNEQLMGIFNLKEEISEFKFNKMREKFINNLLSLCKVYFINNNVKLIENLYELRWDNNLRIHFDMSMTKERAERFRECVLKYMNNDIIIENNDFDVIIEQFMEKNGVDVCGPDMVTLKGNHQNPLQLKPCTSKYLQRRVREDKIKVLLLRTRLFWKLYENYKKTHKIPIRTKQPTVFDCILHGSCIIYGSEYIKREQNAFLPITYMYNEEAILYDYLVHKGYKTGYCSDVTILHMEGVSTSERIENKKKKVMFRFKNNIKSIEAQLKERKKYINQSEL